MYYTRWLQCFPRKPRIRRRLFEQRSRCRLSQFQQGKSDEYAAEVVNGNSNDILGQYLQQLEGRIGSTVNQEALRLALGESTQ